MKRIKDSSKLVRSLLINFLFLIAMLIVITAPLKASSATITSNTKNEKGRVAETMIQSQTSHSIKADISEPSRKKEARPALYKKRLSKKRLKKLYFLVQLASQQRNNSRASL